MRQAARWSWPVGKPPGLHVASTAATCSGGRTRRASWTTPSNRCRRPAGRLVANILTTGHGGGHDLHLRTLREAGVTLTGHFLGASGHEARFAPDLGESVAWGDERYEQFAALVRKLAQDRDLDEPAPFDGQAPERLDLRGFGAVLFATGFRPDYESWLNWPRAFDGLGFPRHEDGESTAMPGIYFVGVHFLRKRKSSLLIGVGEDAASVAAASRPASAGKPAKRPPDSTGSDLAFRHIHVLTETGDSH
jgi:hypothetical protein